MMARRVSNYAIGAVAGVLLACSWGDQYREDVFYCEESVALLTECCRGFEPGLIQCHYSPPEYFFYNDERITIWPAFDVVESRCILDKTCDELAPAICASAQAARPRSTCGGWQG